MTITGKKNPPDTKDKNSIPEKKNSYACSMRFESGRIADFLSVLDAVAWTNCPDRKQISQFTGLELKTTDKLLSNGILLGLLDSFNGELYSLVPPYPFKGTIAQKRSVVHEALIRMPLLTNVRQFLSLEETLEAALRKAATVQRIENFDPKELTPLVTWAKELKALDPHIVLEDLYEEAVVAKEARHKNHPKKRVVFLSHHSKDTAIIRQISTDLTAEGITVWLHEQRVRAIETVPEKIAQGLVESDFFLIGLSQPSVESPWTKNELNEALLDEVLKRGARILPIKLADCEIPELLVKKTSIDFTISYKAGLRELLNFLQAELDPILHVVPPSGNENILIPGTIVTER